MDLGYSYVTEQTIEELKISRFECSTEVQENNCFFLIHNRL